jgi:uncharacterized protein
LKILKLLIGNTVLLSALYSWLIAQFLKIIIELVKRKKFKTKDFILRAIFGTGGMPSSHSATVVAVAVSIGFTEGFDSALFALAIVLVIIVIRDATGVRFSSGIQAVAINQILEKQRKTLKLPYTKVKEVRGHTPIETFVGAIVGILVSLGLYLLD